MLSSRWQFVIELPCPIISPAGGTIRRTPRRYRIRREYSMHQD
jgi:hypothetical protein